MGLLIDCQGTDGHGCVQDCPARVYPGFTCSACQRAKREKLTREQAAIETKGIARQREGAGGIDPTTRRRTK